MRLLFFIFIMAIIPNAYAEKLEAVSDPWCPYVCAKNEANGKEGYFVDVLKAAMKKHGIDAFYINIPFSRALHESKEGKREALIGVNTEGKPEFLFSQPLGKTQSCFFVLGEKNWTYKNTEDLTEVNFGIVKDYHYGDEIMKYIEKYKSNTHKIQILPTTTNLDQNIKKILGKRIDTFVDDRAVVEWYLVKNDLKGKLKVAGCIKERDLVIAFPKKTLQRSERFIKILNDELEQMKKSGEFEKIKNQYH